jgi:hypothetical protein
MVFFRITPLEPRSDHTLLLTFETGEQRIYDFKPELKHKIFAPLKDIYMQAKNDIYGVVWTDDVDIASEALYYDGMPVDS